MAYKDKDKQREAQRDWVRQKRKGSTDKGSTSQGSTVERTYENSVLCEPIWESEPGAAKKIKELVRGKDIKPEVMVEIDNDGNITPVSGKPKRGKDIKVFADLPPDVQQTINTLSDDEAEHKRRTAIAINYQHMTCSVTKEGIKYGQGQDTTH